MRMKEIIEGILHKTTQLKDIRDNLTKSELDELIKSLAEVKEELSKEWGLINAMKEKGNGMKPASGSTNTATPSTPSSTPTPTSTASSTAKPSLAEQINFGGQYRQVNKDEKMNYFNNGQWEIEPVDKSEKDKVDIGIKTARAYANMARATGKKYHLDQAKDAIQTVKDVQGKKRMANKDEKKDIQAAKDKADLKELRGGKERRRDNVNVKPLKEKRTGDRRDIGQKIAKSGYKGYTEADNVKRKKGNIETGNTDKIKGMPRTKKWGGSGVDAATKEARDMKRKSKKSPVKVYTPEEIAEYNAKNKK